jgi:hypothetical protein
MWSKARVIISPSLPATGTILNSGTWTRKYFWKSVQIGRSFIKERSQNFGSRSFENRSEPSIGCHGRTERHTSSQIQIEINWTKLTPESYGHRGTSRSHVPHWSESVVLQANPIPISYIRKSFGVLEPYFNRRSMYPYRAYIETLLSYGPAAKESQLTGVMWYKDTPGQQDKRTTGCQSFLLPIAMLHTGLSRWYSKQIQFRFRTFARVLVY